MSRSRDLACTPSGTHTIWVPAAAMRPSVSDGCAPLADVETTPGRPDLQVLDFDASVDEYAQFSVAMPDSWNEGTVSFRGYWTVGDAVTTGIALGLQAVAVSDDGALAEPYGSPVLVTDNGLNASNDLCVTVKSGALTIGGAPSAGDLACFRVFRDVSDANDDMTQDLRLLGIQIFYTVDTVSDA